MKVKFTIIVLIITICVIKTNAQVWSNVGSGLNGNVNCLFTDTTTNRLYATGAFTGKVAYWNGTVWTTVPGFPGNYAGLSIATHGSDLIVGSDSIYVYNGSNWYVVAGQGTGAFGISGGYGFSAACWYPPCAQNGMNDFFYVAGRNNAGGNNLLQCDPTNSYAPTPLGPNLAGAKVACLSVYSNTLYMTGNFPTSIAKYTTVFSALPTTYTATNVQCAATYSGNAYFSGQFIGFNGVVSGNFTDYNGTSFLAAGSPGTLTGVMSAYSNSLYVATTTAPGMKIWNGSTLSNIPAAIGSTVNTTAVYNGELYAGGTFTTPYSNIAKYNANPTLVLTPTSSSISCFGGSNGSATCSVSGGLPGYTYSWSPGSYTTATVNGLTAGTYTVKVIDASTMVKTATIAVTQPTSVTATQSQSNVLCNGGSNGSATVVASGGSPGYTYSWSPTGGTTSVASGLNQGAYTCIIKDANNCSITKNFNITQPAILNASASSTNESGPSMNDGSASANPTGGTPGYTYSWSPSGQTTQIATGLTGGSYTCLITDSHGCISTVTVTVSTTVGTGIKNYLNSENLIIYPNPFTDFSTISFTGSYLVNVFDCIGQKVKTLTGTNKIDIELSAPGIYMLEILSNNTRIITKIIKQ